MEGKYADMVGLAHHVSPNRAPMSRQDRAAQFAPFAALTGFGEVIGECGRLTDGKIILSEEKILRLNEKLQAIERQISRQPEVCVLWFQADERKAGGAYRRTTGRVKKLDGIHREVVLTDGTQIPMEDIYELDEV